HLYYALEVACFAIAAALAAALALRAAIPGRSRGPGGPIAVIVLAMIGTRLVMVGAPMRTGYPLAEFLHTGLGCAVATCALGALPWITLWWAVKRGVPERGAAAGGLIGAAAMLFSFALMRLNCPIDEPLHVITWHLMPALLLTALSAVAGALWLRFRPRTRLN
ncbi:MAG TPA: NrsF family protein, partial [Candidatus Binataceae bacterium]